MHVDNWNPDTYLWILQECDVPYIPDQWARLLAKYGKDASKITGTSILGRYLSVMSIKQYKDFRWKDTQYLQELADSRQEQAMKRAGFDAGQIAMAIEQGRVEFPEKPEMPVEDDTPQSFIDDSPDEEMQQMVASLTDEDRKMLRIKWGKAYRPDEWIQLEKLWNDMESSYDIQTAGHKDTLKMLCKTSLKANQLLDMNDIEGFQRLSKVYDQLMKSGAFTAAQNKADKGEFVDSVGELVQLAEEQGFIPRFYIEEPQDKVDATIQDLKNYTKDLVMNEMNLGSLIESAARKFAEQEEKNNEADNGETLEDEEYEIFHHDDIDEVTTEEYQEFSDFLEEQKGDNNGS